MSVTYTHYLIEMSPSAPPSLFLQLSPPLRLPSGFILYSVSFNSNYIFLLISFSVLTMIQHFTLITTFLQLYTVSLQLHEVENSKNFPQFWDNLRNSSRKFQDAVICIDSVFSNLRKRFNKFYQWDCSCNSKWTLF